MTNQIANIIQTKKKFLWRAKHSYLNPLETGDFGDKIPYSYLFHTTSSEEIFLQDFLLYS